TFSGYCKAVSMENASAYLKVVDKEGNTYYSNKITEETPIQFDNGWHRLSVTFSLPEGEEAHSLRVSLETDCGVKTGKGNVAFDCVQLEKGGVANDYNILEDGSFELTKEVLPYKAKNYTAKSVEVEDEKSEESMDVNTRKDSSLNCINKGIVLY
ncbi:MAG: hypothetical protein IKW28_10550, partial [Lachnospiraceae bacterium]|nr:hypothetical protein [Lachnospiraceae bacterium]